MEAPPPYPTVILDAPEFQADGYFRFPDASKNKRFINFVIDLVPRFALTFVIGVLIGLGLVAVGREHLLEGLEGAGGTLFDYVIAYLCVLIYYSVVEYVGRGQTLGKLVTGTRAVRDDGGAFTFGTALRRSLWRIVPFEPFSFLGGGAGWHDRKTGTRVIDLRRPPDEPGAVYTLRR